ncbi:aquaporin-4-like [Saccoglossus kowalevskii]|uniref:Aquaporin-4-like n=1 Tax=Saccoglossus kowalevskii TaxID=10224 RepID=A0ABM0MAB6_SACKO|nr:PREDICTED: aquaporin-4-like [Saccoglossus kowalevskii]
MTSSKDDLRDPKFWRAVVGEFLATTLFVFIGIGSTCGWNPPYTPSMVQIALCFGLTIATMVQCFGHVSGANINPAVTCALLVTRKISFLRAFLYVIAQCIGAVAGAGLIYGVTPAGVRGGLGATSLGTGVAVEQGFAIEYLITFELVFTVFATIDPNRKDLQGSASLAIGIAVVIGHLFAIQFTGASMNSARSFGPAVIMNFWEDHWIYWAGPILGGITAGVTYEYLFSAKTTKDTISSCMLSRQDSELIEEKVSTV